MNVALIWRSIMVASNLSWTPHISMIAARAKKVAAWVHSAFKTRDKFTMMTLFKSLVRSHLEYCCPLWNPQRGSGVKLLEGVQRTFTAKICSVQHLDYWQRLKSLHLLSLQGDVTAALHNNTCMENLAWQMYQWCWHKVQQHTQTWPTSTCPYSNQA